MLPVSGLATACRLFINKMHTDHITHLRKSSIYKLEQKEKK